jgi:hypothetical protein
MVCLKISINHLIITKCDFVGSGELPFRRVDWKSKGKHLQSLINLCLQVNPDDRITAEDAL